MTRLTELRAKAESVGLDKETVRLFGDLRFTITWEKALVDHNTITVKSVEVSDDEISQVVDEIYSDLREAQKHDEIIPFIPNDHPSRRETMLAEVQRQRGIFENAVDCPPPPPPAPIIRPCPIPENPPSIPGIEIAERESPPPGFGRGDERFKNLGDRLGEKIKLDIFKYLDSISAWIWEQFANFNRLTQYDYFDTWYQIDKFQAIYKTEKMIYEFINQAIALVTKIKQDHIPWYLQQDMPAPPVWCVTEKDDYFLLLERPGPIPTLSCDYGGEFIPNRYHELGVNVFCWKFPNQLRAEEFFEMIERATQYQFIPASQPQPQLLLAGV